MEKNKLRREDLHVLIIPNRQYDFYVIYRQYKEEYISFKKLFLKS
jgi:hypothetical protein